MKKEPTYTAEATVDFNGAGEDRISRKIKAGTLLHGELAEAAMIAGQAVPINQKMKAPPENKMETAAPGNRDARFPPADISKQDGSDNSVGSKPKRQPAKPRKKATKRTTRKPSGNSNK